MEAKQNTTKKRTGSGDGMEHRPAVDESKRQRQATMRSKKCAQDKGPGIGGMNINLQSSLPYIKHELEKKKITQPIPSKKAFQEDLAIQGFVDENGDFLVPQHVEGQDYAAIVVQYPKGREAKHRIADH